VIIGLHPAFIKTKGDSLKEIWDMIKQYRYDVMYEGSKMSEADFISQTDLFDVRLVPSN